MKIIAKFKVMFGDEALAKILPDGYVLKQDPDFDDRITIEKKEEED